jgi:hypothetical protein
VRSGAPLRRGLGYGRASLQLPSGRSAPAVKASEKNRPRFAGHPVLMSSREIAVKPAPHGQLASRAAVAGPAVRTLPVTARVIARAMRKLDAERPTTRPVDLIQEVCVPADEIARSPSEKRTDLAWHAPNCKRLRILKLRKAARAARQRRPRYPNAGLRPPRSGGKKPDGPCSPLNALMSAQL